MITQPYIFFHNECMLASYHKGIDSYHLKIYQNSGNNCKQNMNTGTHFQKEKSIVPFIIYSLAFLETLEITCPHSFLGGSCQRTPLVHKVENAFDCKRVF